MIIEKISVLISKVTKKNERFRCAGKQYVECGCKIVVEKELFKRFELKL